MSFSAYPIDSLAVKSTTLFIKSNVHGSTFYEYLCSNICLLFRCKNENAL